MIQDSKRRQSHINGLTSLRFFAAFAIFVLHARNHSLVSNSFLSSFDLSQAVSFFFVLSGFVITYAYYKRSFTAIQFYRKRLARIWPAFAFSILFTLLLLPREFYLPSPGSSWFSFSCALLNFFGLHSWIPLPSVFFSFNAVSWSISVEIFFYALYPLLHQLRTKTLSYLLLAICLFSLLLLPVSTAINLESFSPSTLNSVVWEGIFYINPLIRLPEFLLGIIFCRCYLHLNATDFLGLRNSFSISSIRYLPSVLGFISVLLFFYLGFHSFNWPFDPEINYLLTRWSSACNFGFLMIGVSACQAPLVQSLGCPPLVFLGEISYGIYLYHQPLMIRAAQAGGFEFAGIQILQPSFAFLLAWTLLLSSISFYILEIPIYQILKPKRSYPA